MQSMGDIRSLLRATSDRLWAPRRRQDIARAEMDEPPAQASALADPEGFDTLSDDLVLRACLRAPFMTNGSLHAVCQRFKSLLRSDDFRKQRHRGRIPQRGGAPIALLEEHPCKNSSACLARPSN